MSQQLRDRIRANSQGRKNDWAAIYRPGAAVPSPDFGSTTTYALLGLVLAAFWPVSGQEMLLLQGMNVKAEVTVALAWDTDITEQDEIVYTVTETGAVHHFAVSFVYRGSGDYALRVAATEYKLQPPRT